MNETTIFNYDKTTYKRNRIFRSADSIRYLLLHECPLRPASCACDFNLCTGTVDFVLAWIAYRHMKKLADVIDFESRLIANHYIYELTLKHHGKNESKGQEQTERETADKNESEDEPAH